MLPIKQIGRIGLKKLECLNGSRSLECLNSQTLIETAQATSHERSSPVFTWSLIMKDTVPVQGWRQAII